MIVLKTRYEPKQSVRTFALVVFKYPPLALNLQEMISLQLHSYLKLIGCMFYLFLLPNLRLLLGNKQTFHQKGRFSVV